MADPSITVSEICAYLDQLAPPDLAEEWDNVGLLVGDRSAAVRRVMTCLTVTAESAEEAIQRGANLIITHHPLPFEPIRRLTSDSTAASLLLDLIKSGIAVYSAHTAFDSASQGINQQLARRLDLRGISPLQCGDGPTATLGSGRVGQLDSPTTLGELIARIRLALGIDRLRIVGDPGHQACNIAIACGSGGSLLKTAQQHRCDTFVTGEINFHNCLQAKAWNISLVLLGHYASERFAMEELAEALAGAFSKITVWASQQESDPLCWV